MSMTWENFERRTNEGTLSRSPQAWQETVAHIVGVLQDVANYVGLGSIVEDIRDASDLSYHEVNAMINKIFNNADIKDASIINKLNNTLNNLEPYTGSVPGLAEKVREKRQQLQTDIDRISTRSNLKSAARDKARSALDSYNLLSAAQKSNAKYGNKNSEGYRVYENLKQSIGELKDSVDPNISTQQLIERSVKE